MSNQKHTSIGGLRKPHGLNGELKVFVKETYIEDFLNAKVVFLKIDGVLLPYFVENIRVGNSIIVQFEDIKTKEKAFRIASKELFLPTDKLIPESEKIYEIEGLEYEPYIGYTLQDNNFGVIGKILRVEEFPQQEMAIVLYEEKEIMIPLNDYFIASIDEETQIVLVELPEGLLSL